MVCIDKTEKPSNYKEFWCLSGICRGSVRISVRTFVRTAAVNLKVNFHSLSEAS